MGQLSMVLMASSPKWFFTMSLRFMRSNTITGFGCHSYLKQLLESWIVSITLKRVLFLVYFKSSSCKNRFWGFWVIHTRSVLNRSVYLHLWATFIIILKPHNRNLRLSFMDIVVRPFISWCARSFVISRTNLQCLE